MPSPAERTAAAGAVFLLTLAGWQLATWALHVPAYLLPGPLAIARAFAADWLGLLRALVLTLAVAAAALAAATVAGVALALLIAASGTARAALRPWTVVLQVTPIVAIAPLIVVWIGNPFAARTVCATIVAFFPVLSSTEAGLAATPPALLDLFRLLGASRRQQILWLRLPAALPFLLAGLRIAGGLAIVGAVVAEFVTGAGGSASGLAYVILQAGYQLAVPRMFAALALLALAGWVVNAALGALERAVVRRLA